MKNIELEKTLELKAKDLFNSNKDLHEIHLCSNGQGFTDKKFAERYAKKLNNDKVYTFTRESEEHDVANEAEDKNMTGETCKKTEHKAAETKPKENDVKQTVGAK